MDKVKVTIHITVKADKDDSDEIRSAVHQKLEELMEAEELEFDTEVEEDEEDESY